MQEVNESALYISLYLLIFLLDHANLICYIREYVYDDEGNLLEETPIDSQTVELRKKISIVRNKVEDLIQKAKHSNEAMDFLVSSVMGMETSLDQIGPLPMPSKKDEYEAFIGCKIPSEVHIHPPTDVHAKGRSKRIKSSKDIKMGKKPRKGNSKTIPSDNCL